MSVTGRCRCGAVTYRIARDDLPLVYACHCHVCQRASGSAFSVQALVPEATLTTQGPIIVREVVTEDRVSTQRFCGECLARVYNTNARRPGIAVIRAGTLDRSEELVCTSHIFTAYRQAWVALPDDVPQWPEMPDLAALSAALTR